MNDDLADRIRDAFGNRLDDEKFTIDDVEGLVGDWWLLGEDWWLTCLGHVLPLFLRAPTLTQEQRFTLSLLLDKLDGVSFDGRHDLDGVKLYGFAKTKARAWRKVIPTMSDAEIATLIEFLKSPVAQGYDTFLATDLVAWWEWAAVNLRDEPK